MKIYIEMDNNYMLLTDIVDKNNFKNDKMKEEVINTVMDRLEDEKLKMEISRQKNPVKVKTIGVHPLTSMKRSA